MMGLGKFQQQAKLDVAIFSHCRNIKGEPKNFTELPCPRPRSLFSGWDFVLGQLQLRAKFKVAVFIYNENIGIFLIGINKNGNTLYFWRN